MEGFTEKSGRHQILWFELRSTMISMPSWKGKLVVKWTGKERNILRRAHKNRMQVLAILEENGLVRDVPKWDQISWTWAFLREIPTAWKNALKQWRAIYFIFDKESKKGYVGSAYGEDNLLQRWENYAATVHGGNKLLKKCRHESLLFSILEPVSLSKSSKDVIELESNWKRRLHTRHPYGLNDN